MKITTLSIIVAHASDLQLIMLVSHLKKFIFTKTAKTAGTSVESYYEPFCMPKGAWRLSHERDEYVSEAGIIGYRGQDPSGCVYYNHMPAREINSLVGDDVWNEYFKFTVVRNPFSKLVSAWYHFHRPNVKLKKTIKFVARHPNYFPIIAIGRRDIVDFRSWVQAGGEVIDRDKYMINGEVAVDYFIKQECLEEGLVYVNKVLGINGKNLKLPTFKSGFRNGNILTRDFYDSKTEAIVREKYDWELNYFGYDLPKY